MSIIIRVEDLAFFAVLVDSKWSFLNPNLGDKMFEGDAKEFELGGPTKCPSMEINGNKAKIRARLMDDGS